MLQSYFDDAPQYVNGQRLTCNLDGIAIGCGRAMDLLASGSANIDFSNTDRWTLSQVGIFAVWQSNSGRTAPAAGTDTNNGDVIRVNSPGDAGTWNYYFSNISWFLPRQTQPLATLPEKKDTTIRNALKELTDFLKKGKFSEDCKKNVIDKLNGIKGFGMEKFIAFLELGGDFYDGTKSTALAKDYNPAYGFGPTQTVADSFDISKQTNARTANGINSRFTVFFRPNSIETKEKESRLTGEKIAGITNDNLAFIFHEGLHGFGHYSKNNSLYDQDLQTAFGLSAGASINISEHIKKNCLEYTD